MEQESNAVKDQPEFLAGLGMIVLGFARIEAELEFFLWLLIGTDQNRGQIITPFIPYNPKVDLLFALYKHLFDENEIDLKNRLQKAGRQRNHYLHSQWSGGFFDETATNFFVDVERIHQRVIGEEKKLNQRNYRKLGKNFSS